MIEAAGVTEVVSGAVPAPQRRRRGAAVDALARLCNSGSGQGHRWLGTHHALFGFDERPVLAVHLVVESAGVAEVVSVAVPAPQRRRGGAAVDALAALCDGEARA